MEREEFELALRDYPWMIREISRLKENLGDAGERMVQKYGLESALPKGKGMYTDSVGQEVARRERKWKRLDKLEKKVLFIQERVELITDEREKTILECILDGLSFTAIAKHMGLSTRHIQRLKNDMVDKMLERQTCP
ncbi:LuxR C-terminal-related transcriptional regulator [Caldalkalibacillus mannanilyticus]|uniref:LuxR C-terminal-related transcriptional regulator n=1 Tax=Caldalkalibacillus mannanilyticus TaxID=1418 RepID=UPI0004686726|nr:LuxR C-terminal-related transcriptional regulator [Caldalkalibacillus mannanilyticus]